MFVHMENKLISIGSQKLLNGDFENALWAFNSAALLHPPCIPRLWQRGLCCYYMGRFEEGMNQFKSDMSINGGDIEEVIWNFICKCGKYGFVKAFEAGFLPLKSAANESPPPMSAVLSLFKGEATPDYVISSSMSDDGSVIYSYNNTNALAYAHYYVGVYHQLRGEHSLAGTHLERACQYNTNDYMGGIMRLHYRLWNRDCVGIKAMAPRFKMGNGESSRIIYGGWQLSAGHGSTNDSSITLLSHMLDSINHGVTSFDCGDIYTGVEELLGTMMDAYTTHAGGSREDICIHTKLVPDLAVIQEGGVTEAYVRAIVHRSLNRMNTSYLDLVQFHWWDISCHGYLQALGHLNTLKEEGLVKQIGLTNFGLAQTKEILDSNIPIVSTQVQFSVLDRRPVSSGLVDLCQRKQVSILAYGVLGGGFLTDKWLGAPKPNQMVINRSLVKYYLIIEEFGGWDKYQRLLEVLRGIADGHSPLTTQLPNGRQVCMDRVTIAMVAIAYVLSQPGVDGVILGSLDASRSMESIMAATSIALTCDDLNAIDRIVSSGAQGPEGDVYQLERIFSGRHGNIMKYNLNNINKGHHLDELCRRYLEALFKVYPVEGTRSGYYNRIFDGAGSAMKMATGYYYPSDGCGLVSSSSELVQLFVLRTVTCDHQLDTTDGKDIEKYLVKLTNLSKEALFIDRSTLSVDQVVDLDIILSQVQLEILKWQKVKHHEKDPSVYLPFDAINYLLPTWGSEEGSHSQCLSWQAVSHPGTVHIPPSFKLLAILSRMQRIPQLLSNGRKNLIQPFKPFVERAIQLCESFVTFLKVEFEMLIRKLASFTNEEPGILNELVDDILFSSEVAGQSIMDFKVFLEEELLCKASDDSVSIGEEVYDQLLLHGQMINEGSSELLRMGQSRFEQIKKEMTELATKIIPGKTWQEITAEVIRHPNHHPPSTDLLQSYMREIELSRQHMKTLDLMPTLPQDEEVVGIYTPPCLWPFTPFGDFLNPSPFACGNTESGHGTSSSAKAHTGYLMLHPVHSRGLSAEDEERVLQSHDYSWIKVIAPHECYPGHHVQALLAQAHPRLIRRYHESAYFYEGWGLYCEQLAYETGYFETKTPQSHDDVVIPPTDFPDVSVSDLTRLTQLRLQLWRCARVILDIQLHCGGGLTLRGCRDFLCKEVMFDGQSAAGEVMMYAMRPTYAPCYIIGMMKILALREKEKQKCKLHDQPFDLKKFHEKVLRNGSIPFVFVEKLMDCD